MTRTASFDFHAARYDAWFDEHQAAYLSELLALRPFVPLHGRGLEIGVGTGRFAAPLGVQMGVDPSSAMLSYTRARGIEVAQARAEALPFADDTFDHALLVTTLCFVDSPSAVLREARRVLRPGGTLVIGFIDRDSPLGRSYEEHRQESVFYRDAHFLSAAEVEQLLADGGYAIEAWAQTLATPLSESSAIEAVQPGYGRCGFVIVQARSPS